MWFLLVVGMLFVFVGLVATSAWLLGQAELAERAERQAQVRRTQHQAEFRLQQAAQQALQQMLDEARRHEQP